MEAHFLREWGYEKYLVPEESIKAFEALTEKINGLEEISDEWYTATDEFDHDFQQYKCEGELYNTKLFIQSSSKPKDNELPVSDNISYDERRDVFKSVTKLDKSKIGLTHLQAFYEGVEYAKKDNELLEVARVFVLNIISENLEAMKAAKEKDYPVEEIFETENVYDAVIGTYEDLFSIISTMEFSAKEAIAKHGGAI